MIGHIRLLGLIRLMGMIKKLKMKNFFYLKIPFLFLILLILGLEIFSLRTTYLSALDMEYLRDLYDHSQWMLARSIRSVSDEQLYQVASYDLVTNWKFFNVNPEAPVLAKYFYGYAIKIFGNPNIFSLICYFSSIFLFYLITKEILKKKNLVKIALLIFITEPLIFHQASVTMLDLPQLVFFLGHIFSIIQLIKKARVKKLTYAILAGFSLGCFVSIKIGFFGLIILFVDSLIFIFYLKKPLYLFPLFLIPPLIYIFSYFPYFIQGHNLWEFIKAQKWILKYWLFSASAPNYLYGLVISTILFGITKGWYEGAYWERIPEWTIFWPIYFTVLIYIILKFSNKVERKSLNLSILYFFLLITSFMVFYFFMPFFTRYLLLSLPLNIIITVYYLNLLKIDKKFVYLIGLIFVIQFFVYLSNPPLQTLKAIKQNWNLGTYQDLYAFVDKKTKIKYSRLQFWRKIKIFEHNLGVESRSVSIKLNKYFPWHSKISGTLFIIYQTPIGRIKNNQVIYLYKESNQWKIIWRDSLLLDNFSLDDDKIISRFKLGKFGKIIAKNGEISSWAKDWPYLLVVPNKIKDENTAQKQLTSLTNLKKFELELKYKANHLPDMPAEIGFLKPDFNLEKFKNLILDPGIIVEYRTTNEREYNTNFSKKIRDIQLLENLYKNRLTPSIGGYIKIIKNNGEEKFLLERKIKNGEDISIDIK